MKKKPDQLRINAGFQEDARGLMFFDEHTAKITDLSGVRLLHCGVDTVRQLYRGVVRPEVLAIFDEKPGLVTFAGYRWHSGRVSRDSGYQYKLQNADLGLILLIKNFNSKADSFGTHLKIEVSPHAVDGRSPARLQDQLDHLAGEVLSNAERNQCAVHIALDVQGWVPPSDFQARLHCKAQSQRRLDGVKSLGWEETSAVYGRGQSFLFGSAGGLQLAVYNKTLQARSIDKLDYWEGVWRRRDSFDECDPLNYDPAQPVFRIELRFHHSIVAQFASGSCSVHDGDFLNTHDFDGIAPHLDGLFQYGLENFRYLSRPGQFDPFWSLLRQDARVSVEVDSLLDETHYKRHYKTARGFSGKSVDLLMGNFISLAARHQIGAKKAFEAIQQLPVWPVILDHYQSKELTVRDIYKKIKESLEERNVRWGMAV